MRKKSGFNYLFFGTTLLLAAIGLLMVFSASPSMTMDSGDSYFYLKRHIVYLFLGFAAMYLGFKLNLDNLRKWSPLILLAAVSLLLLVYIPGMGKTIGGATRWIDLFFFSFQPSELIKFAVILFLAQALANKKEGITNFTTGLLPLLVFVIFICGLVVAQPDLGTAIIIASVSFIMFFAAGADIRQLIALGLTGLTATLALTLTSSYRMRRLLAFIDPWKDPQDAGFQIIQSLLAVGSGGFLGLGLGASRQKFSYLPQQYTDFIYAVLCEELGFIGGLGVIVLFVLFAASGLRIASKASDKFSSYLVTGIVSWISFQALLNMAVVVGLLPTTGVTLPLISYGGTSTVVILFSVGILENIAAGSGAKE